MLTEEEPNEGVQYEKKIRLLYALMYYAFELKNDMMLSVQLYQRLLLLLQGIDA